jgi:hypothetical protein
MRISLFELLLVVTPTIAIALGLLMAAINASDPTFVLTLAQSVFLAALLTAVCSLFHRRVGVRAFAGAFLAASLGHFLLVWLSNQSAYAGSFPTTYVLGVVWDQARPDQNASYPGGYSGPVYGSWTSYPGMPGGSGFSGGIPYVGSTIPMQFLQVPTLRPIFVDVGVWAMSLVLGVLCGVVAKSLRGDEESRAPKAPATPATALAS